MTSNKTAGLITKGTPPALVLYRQPNQGNLIQRQPRAMRGFFLVRLRMGRLLFLQRTGLDKK
jgi:hypothetical protein